MADLVVTQVRSSIGAKPKHRGTLRALGLGRIGKSNTLPDRPEIRGMIAKVPHLITVGEETEAPAKRAPATQATAAAAAERTSAKKTAAKKTAAAAEKKTAKKTTAKAATKKTAAKKAPAKRAAAKTAKSEETRES
jgi:large subunit ribosomal protein L30